MNASIYLCRTQFANGRTDMKENAMMKMLGALVLAVGILGAAPTMAAAHGHHDHGGFGFGFNFGGCDGGSFGYSGGCYEPPVIVDPGCGGCGHWEYQTETYMVSCGYWNRVWVGDCCCGHWENVWVAPVYGSRTVRVWIP